MLPNILPILLVQVTLSLGNVILVESALSFLGLGVQPPQASWGSMINSAQLYLTQSPYPVVFPGLAILLTVLGLNFVGDSLAEGLDPRLRLQAADSVDQPALLTPTLQPTGAVDGPVLNRTET
jgi:ABC-type dipeptide/oligopeptide/nickel transport system permease subunit